jgi:fucose 4-O-acetylase-like acetyltransferase
MSNVTLEFPPRTLLQTEPFPSRSASADILKVLSIIAVAFIHGSWLMTYKSSDFDLNFLSIELLPKLFSFCVPVFIFLWAFFLEKSLIKRNNNILYSRFYKLFIPFCLWSLLYFLLLADFENLTLLKSLTKHWSGYGWAGQYYFIILFQLIILFPIIRKLSIKMINYLPVVFLISISFYVYVSYSDLFSIGFINKLGDRPFIFWLPYVVLGILYAHRNIFNYVVPLSVGLISLLLIPLEFYFLIKQPADLSIRYTLPSIFIATVLLSGTILKSKITYESLHPDISKLTQIIAKNTFGIFCINPLVIISLDHLLKFLDFYFTFPGCTIIIPFASTLIVVVLSLLFIYLLKRVGLKALVSN